MKLKHLFNSGDCPICQKEPIDREGLCKSCKDHLEIVNEELFLPLDYISKSYVAMVYNDLTQSLIHQFKFHHELWLGPIFAHFLTQLILQYKLHLLVDDFIYVPMDHSRQRRRGYNQSRELTLAIDKLLARQDEQGIRRVKFNRPQLGLNEQERIQNVLDNFVSVKDYTNRRILLIDDVITTGSTLNACGKALKDAGATEVYGLAIAKAGLLVRDYQI